jgi:beta-RFAP synthase
LGLLSVQEFQGRRFGGAGVMLDQPAVELSVYRSARNQIGGFFAERSAQFVEAWRRYTGIREPVQLEVTKAPPEHVGLGLGTQLGMSVAAALDELFDRSDVAVEARAESVGRGLRSAVGAHGFHRGGLIVDGGKCDDEPLGKLSGQVELPHDWHVVLVRTKKHQGLAGTSEVQAFRQLSDSSNCGKFEELYATLFHELLPAARQGNFRLFGQAVYRYGLQAGEMFADSQGGPFLNDSVARFVEYCRSNGVHGVGQSSWGPTVFCWFDSKNAAEQFSSHLLTAKEPNLEAEISVSAVSRRGALVTVS